jgi:acetamidase/formamidase
MIDDMQTGSIHALRADSFEYGWDNSFEPALEIESGETVLLHVRDASDGQIGPESTAAAVAALDFEKVNPVSGPVYVKGASPGDTLAVELLEFATPAWGWTAIIPGFGLLSDEFAEPWLRISEVSGNTIRFSDQVSLPFRPFPGTLGVAPPEPGTHSIVPPRRWGGNMDIKHLNPGTTLYLPVGVDGALFSLGDTHAAQGDGEVCGTAIETAMDVTLRLSVRKDIRVEAPQYDLPPGGVVEHAHSSYHVCTGVHPDLLEAARDAVRATIDWLGENRGLDRKEAYALASVACDLRIHEVVDLPNWVVGCFVPQSIFEGGER